MAKRFMDFCWSTLLVAAVVTAPAIDAELLPEEVYGSSPMSYRDLIPLVESRLGADREAWPTPVKSRLAAYSSPQFLEAALPRYQEMIPSLVPDPIQAEIIKEGLRDDAPLTFFMLMDAAMLRTIPARHAPWYLDEVMLPRMLLSPDAYQAHLHKLCERVEEARAHDLFRWFINDIDEYRAAPHAGHERQDSLRKQTIISAFAGIQRQLAKRPPGPYLFEEGTIYYQEVQHDEFEPEFSYRELRGSFGRMRTDEHQNIRVLHASIYNARYTYLKDHIREATVLAEQGWLMLARATIPHTGSEPAYYGSNAYYVIVDRNFERGTFAVRPPSHRLGSSSVPDLPPWVVEDFTRILLEAVMVAVADAYGIADFSVPLFTLPVTMPPITSPWFESANIVAGGLRSDALQTRLGEVQAHFDLITNQINSGSYELAGRNLEQLNGTLARIGEAVRKEREEGRHVEIRFRGLPTDEAMRHLRELERERAANVERFTYLQGQIGRITDELYSAETGYIRQVFRSMMDSYLSWSSLPDWYDIPSTFRDWYDESLEHAGRILTAQELVMRMRALRDELERLRRDTLSRHQTLLDTIATLEPIRQLNAECRRVFTGTGWASWVAL